ncbi:ATP-binding protein cassette, sub-family E, member 1 [Trypanosoma rangeli]|uniref:ATP-binding protein cassette, sub-family E, member 1 n=1 Tax=Trypanosoma rangeli TaxID=5698 RepID=A0A422NH83_TRYRA|nr:ATP-binding protein cassette, sub-family E, member 1 [Trypanosoma rangeli]RNF04833.1 ATP-binding protein cassette, sub-family E, member 1 [Trypanosoma rangeli]|eukprot:RNF04833.1 ATP-binding protein cassette, sub-family E, member 1 [Trypanosoma rangeli]
MKPRRLTKSITHDQVAELHELFRHFDGAGEGLLEMSRVRDFFLQIAPGFVEDVYVPVIVEMNLDSVQEITFAQFFLIFATMSTRLPRKGDYEIEQLKEVFAVFDPERTGYIEVNRFIQIMLEEGEPLSSFEGKELFLQLRYYGCLRKGKVNYGEFLSRIFRYSTPNILFASK